jgi:hypothetical protein
MVKFQPSKLAMRVRFPLPAPPRNPQKTRALRISRDSRQARCGRIQSAPQFFQWHRPTRQNANTGIKILASPVFQAHSPEVFPKKLSFFLHE